MKMDMKMGSKMSSEDMMLEMMKKRFWSAIILCIPLIILKFGSGVSEDLTLWIQLIISIPVVFWAGWMFFTKAGKALIKGRLNMFTLVVMGVLSAWLYSVWAMFFPQDFPASFRMIDGDVTVYFDAACYITVIVLLGHVWELKGRKAIRDDISKLQATNPQMQQHLQGAMDKLNTEPMGIQKYIDKVAEVFILFVIIMAAFSFWAWLEYGPAPSALYGLIIAITVLLSACPCVFTLATPLSLMEGVNIAAQNGILVKNPDIFQKLAVMDAESYKLNDVKFALGTNDVKAVQDADVIILDGDNKKIAKAIALAKSTMANIKENIIIGAAYNGIMLPIAAGILYPAYGLLLGPIAASVAMSVSSIIVVLNALRLKL